MVDGFGPGIVLGSGCRFAFAFEIRGSSLWIRREGLRFRVGGLRLGVSRIEGWELKVCMVLVLGFHVLAGGVLLGSRSSVLAVAVARTPKPESETLE